ncbi:hypothetical protein PC121_g10473 [Phytophthora cactorum]|nr:hypothetical protein PC121_g10473 [Phytophthora cactorum]
MKFTNKDLYYLLFTELSPNQARCNTCLKVYKPGYQGPVRLYVDHESGIINIISGSSLTTREQETCKAFKRPATNVLVEETSRSFLAPVFQKASEPRTSYIPLGWVPPTSNECERFFSQVKLVFTDLRKSMDVNTLELRAATQQE